MDEHAQVQGDVPRGQLDAAVQLLLDSGDLTPMAARVLCSL